jgi:hypothetical protein
LSLPESNYKLFLKPDFYQIIKLLNIEEELMSAIDDKIKDFEERIVILRRHL